MAKKGRTETMTQTAEGFSGDGVTATKTAEETPASEETLADDTLNDTPSTPDDASGSSDKDDAPDTATVEEVVAEQEASPVSEMVTGEDVLKMLREQGHSA